MLQFKNGRLYAPGCSFLLPEGCYLLEEPAFEEGIAFWTPDGAVQLEVSVQEGAGTREALAELFEGDSGLRPATDVRKIEVHGLRGHEVFYTGGRRGCYSHSS